jgi:hypothetical protein
MKYVIFTEHGAASLEIVVAVFDVVASVDSMWFCESI